MIRTLLITTAVLCAVAAAGRASADLGSQPPYVVEWPAGTGDILIAETDSYTLHRYSRSDNGTIEVTSEPMSIGRNGAGKQREGDLRTPYGVFFIVDRLDTTPLDPKYGSAAFPLDYPSVRDRQLGRTGDGIWLHGVLPGTVTPVPRDTDGCIAINNATLNALAPKLDVLSTPVIVTRSLKDGVDTATDELKEELLASIDSWTASLSSGRLDTFLAHYAAGFTYRGLSLEDFSVLKLSELADDAVDQVTHRQLFIAADPDEAGVFVSRFLLAVRLSDGDVREHRKRLYWQRDADGTFKVIAEDET